MSVTTAPIVVEKVEQAVELLRELELDLWLTFVRETILGQPVTWQSAFMVTRQGERIAIVGRYEDEAVRSTGAWAEVVSYVEGTDVRLFGCSTIR